MFKFNIKVNNEHRFKSQLNNEHKFTARIKNVHKFTMTAFSALVIKVMTIFVKYRSSTSLGGRNPNTDSAYVVLRARVRGGVNYVSNTASTQIYLLKAKIKPSVVYKSLTTAVAHVKAKMKFATAYFSRTSATAKIKAEAKFNQHYSSDVKLGGKRPLLEYIDTLIQDLPESLEEWCGAYVYVLARARGDMRYSLDSSQLTNLVKTKIKGDIVYTHKHRATAKSRLYARRMYETYRSTTLATGKAHSKAKPTEIYFSKTDVLDYFYRLFARPSVKYVSNTVANHAYLVKAKMKSALTFSNSTKLAGLIKAKMKSSTTYSLKDSMSDLIHSKAKGNVVDRFTTAIQAGLSYVVAKFKSQGELTKSSGSSRGKIKSKASSHLSFKQSNGINDDDLKRFRCTKLEAYTEYSLSELPESLQEFCYNSKLTTWSDVLRRNVSWSAIKEKFTSWADLRDNA